MLPFARTPPGEHMQHGHKPQSMYVPEQHTNFGGCTLTELMWPVVCSATTETVNPHAQSLRRLPAASPAALAQRQDLRAAAVTQLGTDPQRVASKELMLHLP